jgi:hypothetical protein
MNARKRKLHRVFLGIDAVMLVAFAGFLVAAGYWPAIVFMGAAYGHGYWTGTEANR